MIAITTSLKKIAEIDSKIVVVQGGARAGKTMAILLLMIDFCMRHKCRCAVVSHSYRHLMRGAINDAIGILQGLEIIFTYNKNDNIIRINKSTIEFITAEKVQDFKGTQFDLSFINEANYVSREVIDQVILRTKTRVFIDFNPVRRFYVHDLLALREDCKMVKLTYKDNEACPEEIVRELEYITNLSSISKYWENYVKVYVHGEIGTLTECVFPDWKYIYNIPSDARLHAIGLDFGFVNDVTAIIAIYYYNGGYIVDELAYSTNMLSSDIYNIIKDYRCPMYADNSDQRLIAELNKMLGKPLIKPVKFDLNYSIDYIKKHEIFITERSVNIQNEQINYVYQKDKFTGEITNIPIDKYNHAMDAIRYGICGGIDLKYVAQYLKIF